MSPVKTLFKGLMTLLIRAPKKLRAISRLNRSGAKMSSYVSSKTKRPFLLLFRPLQPCIRTATNKVRASERFLAGAFGLDWIKRPLFTAGVGRTANVISNKKYQFMSSVLSHRFHKNYLSPPSVSEIKGLTLRSADLRLNPIRRTPVPSLYKTCPRVPLAASLVKAQLSKLQW